MGLMGAVWLRTRKTDISKAKVSFLRVQEENCEEIGMQLDFWGDDSLS